jgi:hypothetical protein
MQGTKAATLHDIAALLNSTWKSHTCCHRGAAQTDSRPGQLPSGSRRASALVQLGAPSWRSHPPPLRAQPAPGLKTLHSTRSTHPCEAALLHRVAQISYLTEPSALCAHLRYELLTDCETCSIRGSANWLCAEICPWLCPECRA